MIEINTKKSSSNSLSTFIILSIIFILIGGALFAYGYSTKDKGEEIEVTISKITEDVRYKDGKKKVEHNVYVSYTYNNVDYTDISYHTYNSSMREGDVLTAKINPDDPTKFYASKEMMLFGIIFLVFGFSFLLVGILGRKYVKTPKASLNELLNKTMDDSFK